MNPIDMLAEAARIYPAWWQAHESRPVTVMELAEPVRAAADPDSRGRQFIAVKLCMLDGVRAAGFVLARRKGVGKWSPARSLLNRVEASGEGGQCAASPKIGIAPTAADPALAIHAELEVARRVDVALGVRDGVGGERTNHDGETVHGAQLGQVQ